MQGLAILKNLYNKQYDRDIYFVVISCIILQVLANIKAEKVRNVKYIVITQKETYKTLFEPVKRGKYYFIRITDKLDIENPIIRINTAFKSCSSLEKISVLPRIYHN